MRAPRRDDVAIIVAPSKNNHVKAPLNLPERLDSNFAIVPAIINLVRHVAVPNSSSIFKIEATFSKALVALCFVPLKSKAFHVSNVRFKRTKCKRFGALA